MDYVTLVGYLAAALLIATLSMRTMVPLRIIGICSNVAFITYGVMFGSYPTIVLHGILFPLNIYRLREMLTLIESMDWLKPFMHKRAITAGEVLFRKGNESDRMFFVVSQRLHLQEIDIDVSPGAVVGELGMLAPARARTQTLVCT
jgi:CRP/FNR family cyclic AMP-dependent transcriptional regulator